MKPNYYTLAVFAAVCAALVGAHFSHLDDAYKLLLGVLGALASALLPAAVAGGAK
jgi:hypothetical protein